jgi:cytochrome P450
MTVEPSRRAQFPLGASLTLAQLGGPGVQVGRGGPGVRIGRGSDPHRLLAALRADEPVSWVPALGGWLVTSRATALELMRDTEIFTVDDPRFSTAQVVGPSMLSLDGSEHDRHRTPFADPFRRSAVHATFAEWSRAETRRLVAGLAPLGAADLATDLAAPLAVSTVTRALGLVDVDQEQMLGWYTAIVDAVVEAAAGRDVPPAGVAAVADLRLQVDRTVDEAGTSLLAAVAGTGTLGGDEVFSNTAILLFGAIETSQGMTANALLHLLSHPDQLDEVRAGMSPERSRPANGSSGDRTSGEHGPGEHSPDENPLLANAVEESLRFEPAVALVDRYATTDVELGDARIAMGDLVSVAIAGVNRDPATFEDPDRFDVHRPNARQHLSFVHGTHACLGMHLARLETREAIAAVFDLLPCVRLDADRSLPPQGMIFRRTPSVVATWEADG